MNSLVLNSLVDSHSDGISSRSATRIQEPTGRNAHQTRHPDGLLQQQDGQDENSQQNNGSCRPRKRFLVNLLQWRVASFEDATAYR